LVVYECVKSILVLSANKIGVDSLFIDWSKSFMYRRNSRGPRMVPCGNPCLVNAQLERVPKIVCLIIY